MASAGMPYGLQAMLKEGYTHVSGMTEAVYKNLEACKELSKIAGTSMGPNGAFVLPGKRAPLLQHCGKPQLIQMNVGAVCNSELNRSTTLCRHEQDCDQSFGQDVCDQ